MRTIKVVVRMNFNLWNDTHDSVFDCEIVQSRYGKHSIASAWSIHEKQEIGVQLFLVDYWDNKSLSIYSVDFEVVSKSLLSLGLVDVWLEKL